ncbi:SDR family oxidoreductase [Microbacterium sp.]|uniref:SDR family oxidoreductase n=1 Tax=Microbacterium sp. TaxID=51671 RepID=UPI0037C6A06F
MRVLTYGATGVQGGAAARQLAKTDHEIVALLREPEQLGSLADLGIVAVGGDAEDRASLDAATAGADRVVFHLPLVFDRETGVRMARNVLEASQAAGVGLVIFNTGSIVPSEPSPYLHLDLKRQIVDMAEEIGQPMISLRPRLYYEVLGEPWVKSGLVEQSTLAYPLPADHKTSWCTVEDVGAVAAACLERPDLAGAAIEVGGPDALSGTDLADAFGRATGRQINYYPLAVADFEKGLQQNFGDAVGTVIAESFYHFEDIGPDGMVIPDAAATAADLGVTLTSIDDWIAQRSWAD